MGRPFDEETIRGLAERYVEYRRACPTGGAAALQEAVRRAARKHRRNFSELWAEVHRAGHAIMDAAS